MAFFARLKKILRKECKYELWFQCADVIFCSVSFEIVSHVNVYVWLSGWIKGWGGSYGLKEMEELTIIWTEVEENGSLAPKVIIPREDFLHLETPTIIAIHCIICVILYIFFSFAG
jgi:hypothetical protein